MASLLYRSRCSGLTRLILGVGNPMYGDDAAGYCAARALEECGPPPGVRVEARQTITLADAALLEGVELAVFIDAAPGEPSIETYDLKVEKPQTLDPWGVDSHGVSPLDLLRVAVDAGVFRGRAHLVLVRAPAIEFGRGLSPGMVSRVADAARLAVVLAGVAPPGRACIEEWVWRCVGEPILD